MLSTVPGRSVSFAQTWLRLLWIPNVRHLAEARFLTNIYFYSAVIVLFETSRGLTFTGIFLLESVLSLSAWLLDIPTGVWADRLGYRRLLIASRMLNAASVVVMLLAHGFLAFSFGAVLFGAGLACASGSEDALLLRSLSAAADTQTTRGSAFALLGACSSAGFMIGLATGSLFAASDPALAVAATIVPATLAIASTWALRPMEAEPTEGDHDAANRFTHPLVVALRLIRRQPALLGLSLAQSVSFVCINAIYWYNQPFLARVGVATRWFGPLTAIAVCGAVIMPLLLPLARRRLSRRVCIALALIAPGVAYLALVEARGMWAVVALIALVAGGSAWVMPMLREAINERIVDGARATTLSALSFFGAIAGMVANALVGRAGDAGLGVVGVSLGCALIILAMSAPWLMAREAAR